VPRARLAFDSCSVCRSLTRRLFFRAESTVRRAVHPRVQLAVQRPL
jgi:hypothetical protein